MNTSRKYNVNTAQLMVTPKLAPKDERKPARNSDNTPVRLRLNFNWIIQKT